MAIITDNSSHPEQRDATRALRDEIANLSLGGVADSMRASRYAVSSVDGGNVPTLVGAQVGGNTGTQTGAGPLQVIGQDSVLVTTTGNLASVRLVNDSAAPSDGTVYGMSPGGTRGYYPAASLLAAGTNVTLATTAGVTTISSSGGTGTIASGTATLGTSAIASGAKAATVTVAATGVATNDTVAWSFNSDPTSTTGYAPSAGGTLDIIAFPTSGNVNFIVCNNTAASITPGAVTLNWSVIGPSGGTVYATLNPSDKNANIVLSGGNLTATVSSSGTNVMCRATLSISGTKKCYWESTATYSAGLESVEAGVASAAASLSGFCGQNTNSAGGPFYGDGNCYYNNAVAYAAGTIASGTTIGYRYDAGTGTYEITTDGTTWHTVHTGFAVAMFPAIDCARTTSSITMNFGQSAFHFTVPAGYQAGVY